MWLNLVLFVIKVVLVITFCVFMLILYVRGLQKFIYQDVPFLQLILLTITQQGGNAKNAFQWLSNLNFDNLGFSEQTFHQVYEDLDDTAGYFVYAEQHFSNQNMGSGNVQKIVEEGIEYLQENVDFEQFGNNIVNMLNNL